MDFLHKQQEKRADENRPSCFAGSTLLKEKNVLVTIAAFNELEVF